MKCNKMRIIAFAAVAVPGVILCFLCISGAREDNFALHSAVTGRDRAAVRELLVRGADPNAKASGSGETPLHRVEDKAIAGLLIEAGADANVRDELGETPLHVAVRRQKDDALIASLVAGGADVSARDAHGNTPLHTAAWWGKDSAVRTLLKLGAPVNARNSAGNTPLYEALQCEYAYPGSGYTLARVGALLEGGADVHAVNERGRTALHEASEGALQAYHQGAKLVRLLLDAGANPHAQDAEGNTPLHLAARCGELEIAHLLLDGGADPALRNKVGQSGEELLEQAKAIRELQKAQCAPFELNGIHTLPRGCSMLHAVVRRDEAGHLLVSLASPAHRAQALPPEQFRAELERSVRTAGTGAVIFELPGTAEPPVDLVPWLSVCAELGILSRFTEE